jgi:purine-cytosine permease-like protein
MERHRRHCYTVCALAGRAHLAETFTNLLVLLGYFICILIAISLEEHLLFRRLGKRMTRGRLRLHLVALESEGQGADQYCSARRFPHWMGQLVTVSGASLVHRAYRKAN